MSLWVISIHPISCSINKVLHLSPSQYQMSLEQSLIQSKFFNTRDSTNHFILLTQSYGCPVTPRDVSVTL